ncbi:MAG: hypothetical protein R3324_06055 [Halobacteriales archaeon]|nr:hypothetical protein [Halobacteriales archaeon]
MSPKYSGSGYNRVRLERDPDSEGWREIHDPEPGSWDLQEWIDSFYDDEEETVEGPDYEQQAEDRKAEEEGTS